MVRPRSDLAGYLGALQDYFARHQVIPSITGLSSLWGISGRSWTHRLVQRLKEGGYLEETPGRRLRPGGRFYERNVADTVSAGLPVPSNEVLRQGLAIDRFLVTHPSHTELFEVRGDSMIGAQIADGDFVIIERRADARPGEIVLAHVDGEFTLKHLARDDAGLYLRPDNPSYLPIRPQATLEIYGVMVGLFRRTHSRTAPPQTSKKVGPQEVHDTRRAKKGES